MAESLSLTNSKDRDVIYSELIPQIASLIKGESDLTANLANVSAALKQAFGFWWVGFYLVKEGQLVLGPFQGPIACTRIDKGKGVCGTAWERGETMIIPNVDEFPGHIACSAASRSEIVVPILGNGDGILGVLDIDSDRLNDFSATDAANLEAICELISKAVKN
jgi:GAF domain-containing protein